MARDSKTAGKSDSLPARDAAPGIESVAPQPAANPVEVMNAGKLVESLILNVPSAQPLVSVLQHVAALVSYHRLGTPVSEALIELEVAGIGLNTIEPGLEALKQQTLKEGKVLAGWFYEKTGTEINPENLDSKPRTAAELDEQTGYKQEAVELQALVSGIRAGYFPATPKTENVVVEWIRSARGIVENVVYEPSRPVSTDIPGWKTPPVLDKGKPAVAKLYKQLKLFESKLAQLGAASALAQLANLGFSIEVILSILDKADELAQAQITRSDTITKLASDDQDEFIERAGKITANLAIVKEAEDYLATRK